MSYLSLFLLGIVLLIVGIYYSLKKGIKIIPIFLVAALVFYLIRHYFLFGIPHLGLKGYNILEIFEKDSSIIIAIQSIIGMNSATAEVVIIIIGLIYLLSGKFLRKSKIIISSILLIVLSISISNWISIFGMAYHQSQNLKFYKERYSDLAERINRDRHQQMKEKNKIQ